MPGGRVGLGRDAPARCARWLVRLRAAWVVISRDGPFAFGFFVGLGGAIRVVLLFGGCYERRSA
jgi:hypothetical protein